jgi:hypothetical protein
MRWAEIDIREIGCGGMGLIDLGLGYGPVKGSSEHGNETSDSIKCSEILE